MSRQSLSAREARRAQLVGQGLLGRRPPGGPAGVLALTRGVQLDTISVLARSHELVAFARLGPVSRRRIEADYWGGPPFSSFEYWYHAACVLPLEEWPHLEFKRRRLRARGYRWHQSEGRDKAARQVLRRLASEGPLTAQELGGAKKGGPWWDWSEVKIAAEWLLDIGEVVCTSRRGFQRVYDLPEMALPPELLEAEPDEDSSLAHLASCALRALGVATAGDIATYIGVKQVDAKKGLLLAEAEEAAVEGWNAPAYLAPAVLEEPAVSGRGRARPRLLSPFDSLVCDRRRLERTFGFRHRLEAYVPRHKRLDGYYSMPVLAGDRLVARVDPGRDDGCVVAKSVRLEPGVPEETALEAVAGALFEAARWVGSDQVRLERVEPLSARDRLLALLVP